MSKLIKRDSTIEAEMCKVPGYHTPEYAYYCGVKSWVKPRHWKKAYAKLEIYSTTKIKLCSLAQGIYQDLHDDIDYSTGR